MTPALSAWETAITQRAGKESIEEVLSSPVKNVEAAGASTGRNI
jgi:hypothetical protein